MDQKNNKKYKSLYLILFLSAVLIFSAFCFFHFSKTNILNSDNSISINSQSSFSNISEDTNILSSQNPISENSIFSSESSVSSIDSLSSTNSSQIPELVLPVFKDSKDIKTLPIFVYHHIAALPKDSKEWPYYVTPEVFETQMKFLSDNGFHTLNMAEMSDILESKVQNNPKNIVISFDDGYLDNYENALPVMKKYGFKGIIALISGKMQLSTHQIDLMMSNGIEVASHTVNHKLLSKLSTQDQRSEIVDSKKILVNLTGKPVDILVYPGCDYNKTSIEIAKEAGYKYAFSCSGRTHIYQETNKPYELRRMHIDNGLESLTKAINNKIYGEN